MDRDSIQIRVNVNAQSLDLHALMIRHSIMWHANVFALIDQSTVPILRYSTMINVDVDAPIYSDALVDSGLIHVHVDVSVLNQKLSVLMLRSLMM